MLRQQNRDALKLSDTESALAIRRKLSGPADPFDQAGMAPPKALRLAFARACEDVAQFEASITGFDEDCVDLAAIIADLKPSDLILATRTTGGLGGLALWDGQVVAAFVELLITGRVAASGAGDRVPTATDGAVIGGIFDAIMAGFDAELDQVPGIPAVTGFRRSGVFVDGRALSMALPDVPYRRYRLALNLGTDAKNGCLQLIFPSDDGRVGSGGGATDWESAWRSTVSGATAAVSAVLHRFDLPLERLIRFEIGTLVPVPAEAISNVSLEGSDRRAVAAGRLGQSKGNRAVRVIIAGDRTGAPDMADMADMAAAFENVQPAPQIAPQIAPTPAAGGKNAVIPAPVGPADPAQPEPVPAQLHDADGLAVS